MKQFIYCETTEGGMDTHIVRHVEELSLTGWMEEPQRREDEMLVEWCEHAEVGEMHGHRLGVCIRLLDIEG